MSSTDQSEVSVQNGTAMDYDGSGNLLYIGSAEPGSATSAARWLIKKVTVDGSGNITRVAFANGSPNSDQVWDNRAALSYS